MRRLAANRLQGAWSRWFWQRVWEDRASSAPLLALLPAPCMPAGVGHCGDLVGRAADRCCPGRAGAGPALAEAVRARL